MREIYLGEMRQGLQDWMLDLRKKEESQNILQTGKVAEWWSHLLLKGKFGLKQFEYGGHSKLWVTNFELTARYQKVLSTQLDS